MLAPTTANTEFLHRLVDTRPIKPDELDAVTQSYAIEAHEALTLYNRGYTLDEDCRQDFLALAGPEP